MTGNCTEAVCQFAYKCIVTVQITNQSKLPIQMPFTLINNFSSKDNSTNRLCCCRIFDSKWHFTFSLEYHISYQFLVKVNLLFPLADTPRCSESSDYWPSDKICFETVSYSSYFNLPLLYYIHYPKYTQIQVALPSDAFFFFLLENSVLWTGNWVVGFTFLPYTTQSLQSAISVVDMHLYSESSHYEDYKCVHKKFLYGSYTGTKFKWVSNKNLAD